MSNNEFMFSIMSATILIDLCDNFPQIYTPNNTAAFKLCCSKPSLIDRNEEIESQIKNIKTFISLSDDILMIQDGDDKEIENRQLMLKDKLAELEQENQDISFFLTKYKLKFKETWEGTLLFLEKEELIRNLDYGYQITIKGYSHLGKEFKDLAIRDLHTNKTRLETLREFILNPNGFPANIVVSIIGGLASQ